MNYNKAISETMPICEPDSGSVPVQSPPLAEMLIRCDSVLGDCIQVANSIMMSVDREAVPPIGLDEPGCVLDCARRCCSGASTLLEALMRIQARIG